MTTTTTTTTTARVRFFAGAAEAAETAAAELELPAGATLADLRGRLAERHPSAARVLEISSFLVDDVVRADLGAPLTDGTDVRVDVLPPFAGG